MERRRREGIKYPKMHQQQGALGAPLHPAKSHMCTLCADTMALGGGPCAQHLVAARRKERKGRENEEREVGYLLNTTRTRWYADNVSDTALNDTRP